MTFPTPGPMSPQACGGCVQPRHIFIDLDFEAPVAGLRRCDHVTCNPAHRWFHLPAMKTDEVVLLKCYDSATDGGARFAPHGSFRHPTAPKTRRCAKASNYARRFHTA